MAAIFLLLPTSNKEKVGILTNVLKRINDNMTSAEQVACSVSGIHLLFVKIFTNYRIIIFISFGDRPN